MRNLTIMAIILLLACKREAPQPTDPLDLLPPATQTGENTLGFLLDGEPWTPNRLFQGDYRKSDGAFGVACRRDEFDDTGTHIGESFAINFFDTLRTAGTFQLKELPKSRGTFMSRLLNCRYNTISQEPGTLTITKFDTINRVIAGTFSFTALSTDSCLNIVSITHGRFDVSF